MPIKTSRSLRYVCERLQLELTAKNEKRFMDQYAKLPAFDDSQLVLKTLKARGIATAILSNSSREMLATVVESNGLKPYVDKVLTVEEVKLFKTSPQSYQLLIDAFRLKKEKILFVCSNAWDAWVRRGLGWMCFG